MKRSLPALLSGLLLLGCAGGTPARPQAGGESGRAALNAACNAEAERVVRYRDRGQLMRQDDYNARVGTTSHLGPQVITDQIAQVYERDRLAAECARGAARAEQPRAPAIGPAGAPVGR
ncbi:hypothetical protein ACFQX4_08700 [Roseomonas sp. GCM10028921]